MIIIIDNICRKAQSVVKNRLPAEPLARLGTHRARRVQQVPIKRALLRPELALRRLAVSVVDCTVNDDYL